MYQLILFALCFATTLNAQGVCQKCERIRAENAEKAKDQKWVFYEDWLEHESGSVNAQDSVEHEADESGEEAPH